MTHTVRTMLESTAEPPAAVYDVALLDLDGVVYVGPSAVAGAREHLLEARSLGMRLAYVTNNASRTPDVVAAHLRELGMPAQDGDVVTSAQAAARVAAELVPPGSPVLVVGGEGLRAALRERGLEPVASADDEPVAVVQGFSPDLGWALLAEGAYALERGVPWVASNTDLTIPTPRGRAPGNGTLVEVLRRATGREPVVAGKPETPMHAEAVARTGSSRPLVVGDRLDTDIEGANRAGVASLLVFTGVTDEADVVLATDDLRPAFIADDLGGLHHAHPATHVDGNEFTCGTASAQVVDGTLRVHLSGPAIHRLDAVRAACAAAWTHGVRRLDPAAVRRELARVLR
jgi:HAD superfamily hydrolase (TIGR01450 family)